MFWTILGKLDERFVNRRACKNLAAIGRACRHKIDGRVDKNCFESAEPSSSWSFGAHRAPLQFFSQPRQQFLVDVVESAVAENGDNVSLF